VGAESSPTEPSTHATKCVERNKRRALNGFEFTIHTSDFSSHLPADNKYDGDDFKAEDLYADFSGDDANTTSIYEESVIFDEENAVILLSTAFRTIPHQIHDVNINININSYHELRDFTEDSFDDNSKKRGAYYCGKCGKLKKGHICNIPSPTEELSSPTLLPFTLQAAHTTLQFPPAATPLETTFQPQVTDAAVLVIAQPVVS